LGEINKKQKNSQTERATYIVPEEDIVHPVGEGFLLHGHTLLLQLFDMFFFIFGTHGHLGSQKPGEVLSAEAICLASYKKQ